MDASFSFAHQGGSLSYEWVNLSGLNLLSPKDSLNSARVLLQIPQISQATAFRMKLTVTDSNLKSSSQEIELRAKPMILPPIAVVRPIRIILEDSDNPLSVKLDASSSSRGGGALSYLMGFRTHFNFYTK